MPDFAADLLELESAEDFLDYFGIAFDPAIVRVNRLHILQRCRDYLAATAGEPDHAAYRACLARAYDDFVRSDALTERVFKVLQRAAGVATVPLAAVGRGSAQ